VLVIHQQLKQCILNNLLYVATGFITQLYVRVK